MAEKRSEKTCQGFENRFSENRKKTLKCDYISVLHICMTLEMFSGSFFCYFGCVLSVLGYIKYLVKMTMTSSMFDIKSTKIEDKTGFSLTEHSTLGDSLAGKTWFSGHEGTLKGSLSTQQTLSLSLDHWRVPNQREPRQKKKSAHFFLPLFGTLFREKILARKKNRKKKKKSFKITQINSVWGQKRKSSNFFFFLSWPSFW